MKYFAYGSNMLTERIKERCKSAIPLGTAYSTGYKICFIKTSQDGSGKATLVKTDNESDSVPGVLFEIKDIERNYLDKAEGTGDGGYVPAEDFSVMFDNKTMGNIRTYIAPEDKCNDTLPVYDWYLALVIAGARQHKIIDDYIKGIIESHLVTKDENDDRKSKKEALEILKNTGNNAIFGELKYKR